MINVNSALSKLNWSSIFWNSLQNTRIINYIQLINARSSWILWFLMCITHTCILWSQESAMYILIKSIHSWFLRSKRSPRYFFAQFGQALWIRGITPALGLSIFCSLYTCSQAALSAVWSVNGRVQMSVLGWGLLKSRRRGL